MGHRQEVCGLKWSPDNQYLASGGNDNRLHVWNMQSLTPVQTYTDHLAAVKAIAWSPHHHGLLASGGGTADRCIRFWNTLTGQPMQCVDTGRSLWILRRRSTSSPFLCVSGEVDQSFTSSYFQNRHMSAPRRKFAISFVI